MKTEVDCETHIVRPQEAPIGRLDALDALRGFIMIFMAVDHTVDITIALGKQSLGPAEGRRCRRRHSVTWRAARGDKGESRRVEGTKGMF